MPRPSVTTGSANNQTAATTQDLTFTVPADAKVICVAGGGFASGANMAQGAGLVSVRGDPTGANWHLNDLELVSQTTADNQWAFLFAIYDTNANWPGTGSVTIRVTYSSSGVQQKSCAFCLADVATAAGALNSSTESLTQSDSATTPSQTITSSANALNIGVAATYSADIGGGDDTLIHEVQNGASSSSLYVWSEDGTGSSDTIEGNASVNWAMVSASFEGLAVADIVQSTRNSGGTATLTLPNTPVSGNLLIYGTTSGNSGVSLNTAPTGFTELTSHTAADFSSWWGYKISDGTETSANHAWSAGNGYSFYAEYYWQEGTPRVQTNSDTSNVTADGAGPQSTGSTTPDDLTTNICLAFISSRYQPNVDGSGAFSNSYIADLPFTATPTIAGTALASLANASGSTSSSYSWSDSVMDTYGAIGAFSPPAVGGGGSLLPLLNAYYS